LWDLFLIFFCSFLLIFSSLRGSAEVVRCVRRKVDRHIFFYNFLFLFPQAYGREDGGAMGKGKEKKRKMTQEKIGVNRRFYIVTDG